MSAVTVTRGAGHSTLTRTCPLADGKRACWWYDRHTRMWVVQTLDADGCQIGDAAYVGTQREALLEVQWLQKNP